MHGVVIDNSKLHFLLGIEDSDVGYIIAVYSVKSGYKPFVVEKRSVYIDRA